jgi:hypothetical protein
MPVRGIISLAGKRSWWRAALVICVAFAFLGIQLASATHAHDNGYENDHACAICHAGHIPVIQTVAQIGVARPDLTGWSVPGEEFPAFRCHLPASQLSRAPPA